MKQISLLVGAVLALTGVVHAQQATLQGVPVDGELAKSVLRLNAVQPKATDADFTFDDIEFWVGEGENKAALVLQWNDEREQGALVWGYKFDGTSNGVNMLKAIAAADPRLYFSGANSAFGLTINGIGYDLDNDGEIGLMNGDTEVEIVDGYANTSATLTATDPDDLWLCGFSTSGYWSYWLDDNATLPPTSYASTGASGRSLTNNSVDGWNYGNGSITWKTLVAAPVPVTEPALPETFTDGFFLQNEDWFGHVLSSINWVASDGTVYYNADDKANDNTEVLGNTSQFGQIYGDYYYVTSKQAPRFIVLDAKTLKMQKIFAETGVGDGRDVLNVDDSKVYVGGQQGIAIYDKAAGQFTGETVEGASGGQIGMMVRMGNYVFAAKQSTGVLVIDPATDEVVQTIDETAAQGLTVTRNGYIWCSLPSKSSFMRIDPVSLETETFSVGKTLVSSWGQCKPDYVCASYTEDAIFFVNGASRHDSAKQLSKFVIDENGSLTEDTDFSFTMPSDVSGLSFYGSPRVNPVTGDLIATVMTYSGERGLHLLLYIDPETGEVKNTTRLTNDDGNIWWWFPSLPIFPDNNAPEVAMNDLTLNPGEEMVFNVADYVTDADNLAVMATVAAASGNEEVFTVANDGLNITITARAAGTATLDLAVNSNGKTVRKSVAVNVLRPLPGTFTDGFFLQNEDWFGHAMGSINWVDGDGYVYYNVDNKANGNTEVLGNTSQYGTIYGGYYYAMSKQAPRLVVMDAATLQVVKSFDTIGGDGRAVLGVDAGKVYVGTSAGIFTLDVDGGFTLGETAIEGTDGQIGMMARVGKYVFAAKQSTGVLVIDPETDEVVKTIENTGIGGLTVDRNGTVWATAQSDIVRINPVTLESETQALPNSMVSPWGSWMADKMCADPDEDALYYAYGGSWPNSETQIGKLVIGEDGTLSEDADFAFTMPAAATEGRKQLMYGKIDIDPQSGYLIATTTQDGYGANYSYNWLHYIDCETGEVAKTVTLTSDTGENYYWFPALPVFPDNEEPEITLDEVQLLSEGEPMTIDTYSCIFDGDNMPVLAVVEASSSDEGVFTVANDGLSITISPTGAGEATLEMTANSNGRIVEKSVKVTVEQPVSVSDNLLAGVAVYPTMIKDALNVTGATEGTVTVFDLAGSQVAAAVIAGDTAIDLSHLASGAYIVKVVSGDKSYTTKVIKL